jgi:hypothetical protein
VSGGTNVPLSGNQPIGNQAGLARNGAASEVLSHELLLERAPTHFDQCPPVTKGGLATSGIA